MEDMKSFIQGEIARHDEEISKLRRMLSGDNSLSSGKFTTARIHEVEQSKHQWQTLHDWHCGSIGMMMAYIKVICDGMLLLDPTFTASTDCATA